MKLAIVAVGSRGDVQPYVALGLGLQRAGHDVRLVAPTAFEQLAGDHGLAYVPFHTDLDQALRDEIERIGTSPRRLMSFLKRHFENTARQSYVEVVEACREVDAVIASNLSIWAYDIAEARGIPCLGTSLQPINPTRSFRSTSFPRWPSWLPFESSYNWWSFRWATRLFFRMTRDMTIRYRRELLGLPPRPWSYYLSIGIAEIPMVYGYSRHILPKPPDWGDWLHVTGYWFLEQSWDWEPPREIVEFLAGGSPPVYFGLGSMIDRDARGLTDMIVTALEQTGRRGILSSGWSNLGGDGLPETILQIGDVPHDWLFPRMAAVVHHGGAGTTHTGLRAGVPTIVIPFFGDQFFWGDRVFELDAGPRPIPRRTLSVSRLIAAIERATNHPTIRRAAGELGEEIQSETGVEDAIDTIEALLARTGDDR